MEYKLWILLWITNTTSPFFSFFSNTVLVCKHFFRLIICLIIQVWFMLNMVQYKCGARFTWKITVVSPPAIKHSSYTSLFPHCLWFIMNYRISAWSNVIALFLPKVLWRIISFLHLCEECEWAEPAHSWINQCTRSLSCILELALGYVHLCSLHIQWQCSMH